MSKGITDKLNKSVGLELNWGRLKAAQKDYQEKFALLDKKLYELCEFNAEYNRIDGIVARLWIIARSYMTGLERQIDTGNRSEDNGRALRVFLHYYMKRRLDFNKILNKVRSIKKLTRTSLSDICEFQSNLFHLLSPVLREKKLGGSRSPRSFISKYFHFHNPCIPIIDTVSQKNLNKIVTRNRSFFNKKLSGLRKAIPLQNIDKTYYLHSLKLLLFEAIKEKKEFKDITVKELDYFLLTH